MSFGPLPIAPAPFVEITLLLLALGILIGTIEDLFAYRVFSDTRLLSWKVSRLGSAWSAAGWSGAVADVLLCYRGFRWLLGARLIAAGWLLLTPTVWGPRPVLLGVLALGTLAYNARSPFGLDGSHQMTVVKVVPLFLASLLPYREQAWALALALAFIGAQSCLAYLAAGLAKLASEQWRSGAAVAGIMRTEIYGNALLQRAAERIPGFGLATAWWVILFESLFPAALFGPTGLTLAFLAAGLVFHAANAIFMGLNLFFFAFLASYPAILYLACWIGAACELPSIGV